jgi:hypothetical protein
MSSGKMIKCLRVCGRELCEALSVIPGKPAKRRQWRMKQAGFEDVSRFLRPPGAKTG